MGNVAQGTRRVCAGCAQGGKSAQGGAQGVRKGAQGAQGGAQGDPAHPAQACARVPVRHQNWAVLVQIWLIRHQNTKITLPPAEEIPW